MAKIKNQGHLYKIFDMFLETCLIKSNSILNDSDGIFTLDNINICIEKFVDDFKDDKRDYHEKIKEQFKDSSDDVKLLFAHVNWLWSFPVNDMTSTGKKRSAQICVPDITLHNKIESLSLYPEEGFGNAGSYHKQNKYWEIVANLKILKCIKSELNVNTIDKIKNRIEEIALFAKYDESPKVTDDWKIDLRKIEKSCAMYNILLYLCKPDKYERIASDNHKQIIIDSFSSLLNSDSDKALDNDKQILIIRKNISEFVPDFDFYDPALRDLWNPKLSNDEYNEIQGLSFKKNIILYGPPGTGKTHTAKILAKSFICQKILERDKSKVKEIIEGEMNVAGHIKHLQLHSSYSYEDFIAGIHLVDGKTAPTKGYFYKLCEEIEQDDDKSPYVLILDEINRIDLSRLFGEAFSTIEYRDEKVDLSIGGFKLQVPENLYIIGTMNEIDFSLERLDFALRRRFIWFFYGFDPDVLFSIMNRRKKLLIKINNDEIKIFISKATSLNKKISEIEELGKQYQVGHTYFAEILDIASQFKGRRGYIQRIPIFKQGGPAETLWKLSIEPILNAFFGNLDELQKNNHLISNY